MGRRAKKKAARDAKRAKARERDTVSVRGVRMGLVVKWVAWGEEVKDRLDDRRLTLRRIASCVPWTTSMTHSIRFGTSC